MAQEEPWWTAVWKPLLIYRGVEITYLFYAEKDGSYNGVVLRLHNRNPFPVAYRFQVVFRAGDGSEEAAWVVDTLRAGEMRTGGLSGLFWVPFRDGRSVVELGLRKVRIEALQENQSGSDAGEPQPPPPGVSMRMRSPASAWKLILLGMGSVLP